MISRPGKIARLPRDIREQLNLRLEAAQPGPQILEWLNSLDEVRRLADSDFDGQPVSKQNLSQWRRGGFQDWLALQDLRAGLDQLDEVTADIEDQTELVDKVAALMALRLASLLSRWNGESTPAFEARSRVLNRLCRGVVQLQRQMHAAHRDNLETEALVDKQLKDQCAELRQKAIQPLLDELSVNDMAKLYGGGPTGEKIARFILAVKGDRLHSKDAQLDLSDLTETKKLPPKPKTAKDRAKTTRKPLPDKKLPSGTPAEPGDPQSRPVKANQTTAEASSRQTNASLDPADSELHSANFARANASKSL